MAVFVLWFRRSQIHPLSDGYLAKQPNAPDPYSIHDLYFFFQRIFWYESRIQIGPTDEFSCAVLYRILTSSRIVDAGSIRRKGEGFAKSRVLDFGRAEFVARLI